MAEEGLAYLMDRVACIRAGQGFYVSQFMVQFALTGPHLQHQPSITCSHKMSFWVYQRNFGPLCQDYNLYTNSTFV